MRAGALDCRDVDAGVLGDAPRQRRSEAAVTTGVAIGGRCCGGRCSLRRGRCGGRRLGRVSFRGFRLWRFGLCRGSAAACGSRSGILALASQHGDQRVDLDAFGASRHHDLGDGAFIDGLDFHRRLVGLDLGNHIAGRDLVALLDQPFGKITLFHRGRKGRHGDVDGHLAVSGVIGCGVVVEAERRVERPQIGERERNGVKGWCTHGSSEFQSPTLVQRPPTFANASKICRRGSINQMWGIPASP